LVTRVARRVPPLVEQELPTLPEHMTSPHSFTCISGIRVVLVAKLHVFTFLVPCCDVATISVSKRGSVRLYSRLYYRGHVLFMLVVFIYVYWCPARFQNKDDVRVV